MKLNKITSFLAAAVFAANALYIPAFAENPYVSIATVADLTELSKNCISDSYSVGKTFVLTNDIDLTGHEFTPIGSFGGKLDGGGHTISGFELKAVDSTRGFIGTVAKTGEVKDLNIEGIILPKTTPKDNGISKITGILNDADTTSALSGIERYTSDGGITAIGGIAGENNGLIIGCTFSGSINGSESIGGIAGVNAQSGRIEYCVNSAVITANTNTGGIAGKNYGVIKQSTNTGTINPTANENAQNTGGIAGRSYGAVLQSVNRAEIGYKNAGYNTGGITGLQNGYIAECVNYGHVHGRKDVGGITGQFEPYTNISFSQDELQKRIDENVENLKSDLRKADDKISDRYNSLKSDIDSIDLFNIGERSNAVSDAVNNVSDSLVDTNSSISDSISDISGRLADDGYDLSNRLMDSSENLDNAVNDIVTVVSDVSDAADSIKNNSSATTDSLIKLLDTANSSLKNGSENSEELIETLIDTLESTDLDLSSMDINVDMSDLRDLSRSLQSLANTLNRTIGSAADPINRISDALTDILDSIEKKQQAVNDTIQALKDILDEIRAIRPSISPDIPSATLPPSSGSDKNIFDSIKDFIGNIRASLNTVAYAENSDEKSTEKTLLDMDIKDLDITINREVGGEILDAALIKNCINEGSVDGLSDIGGIAGAIGFDSASNPEENVNVSGSYSLDPSTAIKAVIDTCVNEGGITAKTTSAGGIAGFADIGSVKRCMSRGEISVTEGNYAGGIAGYSANSIIKSISLSDIAAKGYAGGIAGRGRNISECYALTRIDSDGEKLGAIAGSAVGNISYNYFLKEELSGIDGVNYEGKAQPVTEDTIASDGVLSSELKGLEAKDFTVASGGKYMPELKAFAENDAEWLSETLKLKGSDFARFNFKVRFINDGNEIKSLTMDYGKTIPSSEIPPLQKRGGTYGDWDKDVTQKIVRDTTFTAVYEKSTTTIAYGSEPAIMLVEGNFRPGTVLDVTETSTDIADSGKYKTDAVYSFTVTEDTGEYKDAVTVRVMNKSGSAEIGIIENGKLTVAESEVDGSYIKFEMASPGEFAVLHKKPNIWLPITIVVLAAAAAAVFIIYRKKHGGIINGAKEKK